jgi:hypothetical protein
MTDPNLGEKKRADLTQRLGKARSAVRIAKQDADLKAEAAAHKEVDKVKRALGERGPVWWDDASPDFNRHMAKNTLYAEWYSRIGRSRPGET